MADIFTKEKRSQVMRLVKSNGNKSTEIKIIHFFKSNKIKGWRRKYKLFGNPDFVFLQKRIAVFTDGCFWHGHNCRNTQPKNNKDYWDNKISHNIQRDLEVVEKLSSMGWKVIRIWECEIKYTNKLHEKLILLFEPESHC